MFIKTQTKSSFIEFNVSVIVAITNKYIQKVFHNFESGSDWKSNRFRLVERLLAFHPVVWSSVPVNG